MASWLMLMVSLPPNPSSLRVRVWRKLRTLGAVALRPSVYLLPPTPDNFERFQWLGQEVVKDGGEALFCAGDRTEGLKNPRVSRHFKPTLARGTRAPPQRTRAYRSGA